jgi:plastocyanin
VIIALAAFLSASLLALAVGGWPSAVSAVRPSAGLGGVAVSAPPSGAYAADLRTAIELAAPGRAEAKAPGGISLLATGGPDTFGYTYVDSDEPCGPTFNWEDISSTSTPLTPVTPDIIDVGPLDDVAWITNTGFTFSFYGTDYTEVAGSSDGYLNFDNGTADFDPIEAVNQCPITNTLAPNNAIYGFWDDFKLNTAGEIYVQTKGTAPHRRFIVQYHDIPFWFAEQGTVRFQVILFEGSNDILVQYDDVEQTDEASGMRATEGLEGPGGTTGLQYEQCGSGSDTATGNLHNGLAVLYIPPTAAGSIVVEKQTEPHGASGSFEFSDDIGTPPSFSLSDDGRQCFLGMVAGTYTITETNPAPAFDLTDITCSDGNSSGDEATGVATVSLQAGETVTCTFTNTQRGRIFVDKVTDPSDHPQSFAFTLSGGPSALNQSFGLTDDAAPYDSSLVPAGSGYSVTETVPSGWDLISATCTDDSPVDNIDISPGETVTCTFSNRQRGTIVVEKQTEPHGASGTFEFSDDIGAPLTFSLSDDGIQPFTNVVSGTYTITETNPTPAFDLTDITCSDGDSSGDAGTGVATVNLQAGETVTCTFKNRQRGTIVVEKQTEPDGLTHTFNFTDDIGAPLTFSLSDDGIQPFTNVVSGTYAITETNPTPAFDLTDISCSDGDSSGDVGTGVATVSLQAGETVTCTFKNRQRGTIVVEKQTDPAGGAGFQFTDNIPGGPTPFNLNDGQSRIFNNVVVGSYTVTETDPTVTPGGYTLANLGCVESGTNNSIGTVGTRVATINLEAGETVTCTFTNEVDTDGDGVPDSVEGTGDRDGDGILNNEDYDPTGYFYDETTGQIVPGGQIAVTGSGVVAIVQDGSAGFYQFTTDGTAGTYTIQVTLPRGYGWSDTCLRQDPLPFDPTGGPNPTVLGKGEDGTTGFLTSNACTPFYLSFDLAAGDPVVFNNNFPLRPPIPVGGIVVPVNKVELLAPWMGLGGLVVTAAVAARLRRSMRSQ